MDDMKDKSIHFTAQKLTEEIQNMPAYKKFYTGIQVSLRNRMDVLIRGNHQVGAKYTEVWHYLC